MHAIAGGIDGPARDQSVLPRDAVDDVLWDDAERREPFVRELDVDALGLLAENVHLLDHRHLQQAALDVLGDAGQIGETDIVALDGV